ncbi:high affinity immunoglobulin gamma Fc receptor I [Amia ocellicauda]|uniref:high affinity immunoglobulin gamma Fc receptor I n=1 Tax=Amia ocellicauda TaxID=2972642 RepID=UPI0034644272
MAAMAAMAAQALLLLLVCAAGARTALLQEEPLRAEVRVMHGDSELFVGDRVTLRCSVPGHPSGWSYNWYKAGVPLVGYSNTGSMYTLRAASPLQSGPYACQGQRRGTGPQRTQLSPPLYVRVCGGWVSLQAPLQPVILGREMTLSCRVRGNPRLEEVVFYKDGRELQRRPHPQLHLSRLSYQDEGAYWCRASWGQQWRWSSAQSPAVQVSVKEMLTEPVLEVLTGVPALRGREMILSCSAQLIVARPGLRLRYSFRRNDHRLAVDSSEDTHTVLQADRRDAGDYQCKVTVDGLGLAKWSNSVQVEVMDEEPVKTEVPHVTPTVAVETQTVELSSSPPNWTELPPLAPDWAESSSLDTDWTELSPLDTETEDTHPVLSARDAEDVFNDTESLSTTSHRGWATNLTSDTAPFPESEPLLDTEEQRGLNQTSSVY